MIKKVIMLIEVPKCRCERCRRREAPIPFFPAALPIPLGDVSPVSNAIVLIEVVPPEFDALLNEMKSILAQTKA